MLPLLLSHAAAVKSNSKGVLQKCETGMLVVVHAASTGMLYNSKRLLEKKKSSCQRHIDNYKENHNATLLNCEAPTPKIWLLAFTHISSEKSKPHWKKKKVEKDTQFQRDFLAEKHNFWCFSDTKEIFKCSFPWITLQPAHGTRMSGSRSSKLA